MKNAIQRLEEKLLALEGFAIDSVKQKSVSELLQLELLYCLGALEQSSLSKAETEYVAHKGITIGGKGLTEQNNAYKYFQAILRLSSPEILPASRVSEEFLIDLNSLQFLDQGFDLALIKYSYKVPYVLTEYIEWLGQQTGSSVETAVEAAVKLLQANVFGETYPRTILLFINILLLKSKYPLISIQEKDVQIYLTECNEIRKGGNGARFASLLLTAIDASLTYCLDQLVEKEPTDLDNLLKIGELAQLTNETVPTIRYWTKQGLLQVANHSPGGYQLYEKSMVEVVLKIRFLQREKRMSVREIQEHL